MTRKKTYTVAFLSGDGIGPELVGEASRTLAEVAALHGFVVEEAHLPFGGDAVRRFGHPLPPATRAGCRGADAVLVAATGEPALEGVKAELDLTWRVTRVRLERGRIAVVSPLAPDARALAVRRAVAMACARQARLTSVGASAEWRELVDAAAERCPGLVVEHAAFESFVPTLLRDPGRADVVVSETVFAEALSNTAAHAHRGRRMVASGRLSAEGPGIFGPTHGSAPDIAGQGVANPGGILFAVALMLAEGLGERSAAETLEAGLAAALAGRIATPDLVRVGAGSTTREFTDALLSALPGARKDTEFGLAVA